MLWQHVFQVVVCVLGAVQRVLHAAQLPDDGPNGPKYVGANIRYFIVNFNIFCVQ